MRCWQAAEVAHKDIAFWTTLKVANAVEPAKLCEYVEDADVRQFKCAGFDRNVSNRMHDETYANSHPF